MILNFLIHSKCALWVCRINILFNKLIVKLFALCNIKQHIYSWMSSSYSTLLWASLYQTKYYWLKWALGRINTLWVWDQCLIHLPDSHTGHTVSSISQAKNKLRIRKLEIGTFEVSLSTITRYPQRKHLAWSIIWMEIATQNTTGAF